MLSGPFQIETSTEAELLEYASLSEDERKALFRGFSYDEKEHDIYKFFLAPVPRSPGKYETDRMLKKRSFDKVDRVYISCSVFSRRFEAKDFGHPLRIRGQYPVSYSTSRGWSFDYEVTANVKALDFGKAGLKLVGKAKDQFKKTDLIVNAYRTNNFAYWIYKRKWLDDGNDLGIEVLCVISRSSPEDLRVLYCDAKFAEGGRSISSLDNQRIRLPARRV